MRELAKSVGYAFYITVHPFKGFWSMKKENRGTVAGATVLLVIYALSSIIRLQYTGFIFNTSDPRKFNIIVHLFNVILPILLWCVANWSITSLMNGEGRFRDIYMAVLYALVPIIISNLLVFGLSLFFVKEEGDFLLYISTLGWIWTAFLVFSGTLTIHQYTAIGTLVTIALTLVGIALIVAVIMLFASVFDNLYEDVFSIIAELRMRM